MKRFIPHSFEFRSIFRTNVVLLLLAGAVSPAAFAQHVGGHVGGAGHVGAPPASHPGVSHPVAPYRSPALPGVRGPLVRPPGFQIVPPPNFRIGYPYRPIRPRRPFPIYPVPIYPPGFGLFGFPFFGFGYGWGFNSGLWPYCGEYLSWNTGCYASSAYDYTLGYNSYQPAPVSQPPQLEIGYPQIYDYGEASSQYVHLYMKDGTLYFVTDYWLVNGELHFKNLEDHGTKVVEHTVDFDQLDLQKTIDINTARGFRFVLRNEPLEQYLLHHSSTEVPGEEQPQPKPAEP